MTAVPVNPFRDDVNRFREDIERRKRLRLQRNAAEVEIAGQMAHSTNVGIELKLHDIGSGLRDSRRKLNHISSSISAMIKATEQLDQTFDSVDDFLELYDYQPGKNSADYEALLHLVNRGARIDEESTNVKKADAFIRQMQTYLPVWQDTAISEINRILVDFIAGVDGSRSDDLDNETPPS